MTVSDTHVCECGHPISTHPGADYGRGSCVATVLTNAPLGGGSTYQCPCKAYSEVSGSDTHADTIRERILATVNGNMMLREVPGGWQHVPPDESLAALDALVAERDSLAEAVSLDTDTDTVLVALADSRLTDQRFHAARNAFSRLVAERDRERARADRAEAALAHVRENALSWHGPVTEDNRHAKALAVIATWCDAALSAGSGGRETSHTCPCGYSGPEECNGCPGGCKRRPAGVTGWDHIDRAGGR